MVFEKKIPNQDLRSRLDSPVVCAFTTLKSARVSLEVLADSAESLFTTGLILDRNPDRSRCTLDTQLRRSLWLHTTVERKVTELHTEAEAIFNGPTYSASIGKKTLLL